jgi:hypothetical protein
LKADLRYGGWQFENRQDRNSTPFEIRLTMAIHR